MRLRDKLNFTEVRNEKIFNANYYVGNIEKIMFWAFIIGNILYYTVGIILAFAFKDNRAFCKYICPITVIQAKSTLG